MGSDLDFKQMVAAIADGVVVSDSKGTITLWNPSAERIFGFNEDEALGQSLDLIIPVKQRERHWAGYRETMRTGTTRYANDILRVPAIDKNGRHLSIAFTVALLYSSENTISGMVAVIRDETERFQKERDLRKRLAELEQGTR